MSFFHRFSRHHHHHHDHGHPHHCGPGGRGERGSDDASHIEHLTEKVTSRLDLNEAQQEKLAELLECVWAQRAAVKSVDVAKDVGAMISGERLDRAAAAAWIEQRVQSLQTATPLVLTALADFYDVLDTEQQQVLRFMLRMRGRFGGGRHGRGMRWGQ